jgi:8-oxo-dGTP pyrophosphatase MutT (NUDIX family)
VSRTADLLDRLAAHEAGSPREAASLAKMRGLVAWLPRPFDEDADPTHVTSSAIVVGDDGRVLLHLHKRLGLWLQPGGHVDPGEDPRDAVLREVTEETGLEARHHDDRLLHVDVHEGGRGHLHLDLRWLLRAPAVAPRPPAGESQVVEWLDPEEAVRRGDLSCGAAVRAALRRLG